MTADLRRFIEGLTHEIVDCTQCELAERYDSDLRRRNLKLTIDNLPQKNVEYLILAESPPRSCEFFYNLSSDADSWLGNIVFPGFGVSMSVRPMIDSSKARMLEGLQSKGALLIDSCHCACNHLGKKGSKNRSEERGRRASLVASCFDKYTRQILDHIIESNPSVCLLPTYPQAGRKVTTKLKEMGFIKLTEKERLLVLSTWTREQGIWRLAPRSI